VEASCNLLDLVAARIQTTKVVTAQTGTDITADAQSKRGHPLDNSPELEGCKIEFLLFFCEPIGVSKNRYVACRLIGVDGPGKNEKSDSERDGSSDHSPEKCTPQH